MTDRYETMKIDEAVSVLRAYNAWRRSPAYLPEDAMLATGDIRKIGIAIDTVCDALEKIQGVAEDVRELESALALSPTPGPKQRAMLYGYYINIYERDNFYADVRDVDGNTVFEIRAGASLKEGESSIFEDGFMRHTHDLSGLTAYLRSLGAIPQDAEVLAALEFERRCNTWENSNRRTGSE